jgi:putative flippase GtrA
MSDLTDLHRTTPEFFRFLLVGAVGFAVDAAVLLLLIHIGGMSRLWARIPSFLAAVTVTWLLHRNFTFSNANQVAPSIREWLRFTLANAFGNGANLAIYALLVGLFAWDALPALAVASVAALGVNYGLSARWVFKRR